MFVPEKLRTFYQLLFARFCGFAPPVGDVQVKKGWKGGGEGGKEKESKRYLSLRVPLEAKTRVTRTLFEVNRYATGP